MKSLYATTRWKGACQVGLIVIASSLVVGCETIPIDSIFSPGTKTSEASGPVIDDCDGRASIAISRFENKISNARQWYSRGVGDGMADQLTTTLVNSGCFKVVDRQNIKAVFEELNLQQSGAVDPATASRVGKLVGADLMVSAAITAFEENVSGTTAGGQKKSWSELIGAAFSSASAYMAVDISVTDVQTSEIVSAKAIEGRAKDVAGSVATLFLDDGIGEAALSGWENEPRGKALRAVINNAVAALRTGIPDEYFRYGTGRSNTLARSGNSALARKAQTVLSDMGLYEGVIDGKLGPKSSAAISLFQEAYELEITGKLDPATIKQINALTE